MSNVLYQSAPTTVSDGAEKTLLGDDIGRARVVVDVLPPPSPEPPVGQLRFSTGWAPLDYPNAPGDPVAVPGYLEYVSFRTDPALDTTKTWYVLVFDSTTTPGASDQAVETFGPLVENDFDYWEPLGGWEFSSGLYLAVSSTPVLYTAPVLPAATDQFAYTIKFTPA